MKNNTKKAYRIRNWKEYNAALVNRGSLTLWISNEATSSWYNDVLSGGRGASDHYSDVAIECVLMLQQVFHLPLRATQGLCQSVLALMAVELETPNYTTLCRRRGDLEVQLRATAPKKGLKKGESLHVLVDSTGMKVFGEGEWKVRQHGYCYRRTWRKLHLAIDGASQQILATMVTDASVSDDDVLDDLLDQLDVDIECVIADGAYDKKKCYTSITNAGARAIIPPRRGAKIWQHGNKKSERHDRDENLRGVRKKGRAGWKRSSGYHERSLAETAMYRMKQIFSNKLTARGFDSQCVEAFLRCAALNRMTNLGMPDSYVVG
jgi:hypothetical protein